MTFSVRLTCQCCGSIYFVVPSRKDSSKYCSAECKYSSVKPYGPKPGSKHAAMVDYVRAEGYATPNEIAEKLDLDQHWVRHNMWWACKSGMVKLAYVFTPEGEKRMRDIEKRRGARV